MKKCIILSSDNLDDFESYDHLLEEPLQQAGWISETISWRASNVNWNDYDLVMIRSTWDYQDDKEAFLQVLQQIDHSAARLDNPLDVVRWNIDKKYLKELESKGIEIVPTVWKSTFDKSAINRLFDFFPTQELIIKPCVSAAAFDTYRLTQADFLELTEELMQKFKQRDYMVQPFMPAIIQEGEFSVFYFDGEYSHSILKTPKENDFRVQEEYGGHLKLISPEDCLLSQAEKTLKAIDQSLLYARLDFVRSEQGFALMEAELIEPSLYFNLDAESPKRYVKAMQKRMDRMI